MFKTIEKLEDMIAKWLKPLPHLPVVFTKMVAENLWWIVLVGVIFSAIGTFVLIGGLVTLLTVASSVMGVWGYYAGPVYSTWAVLGSVSTIIFLVATVVLMAMAVLPLKIATKKGWTLLFFTMLIQAVSIVLSAIFSGSIVGFLLGIFGGAVSIAISAYLLFEFRSYFDASVKAPTDSSTTPTSVPPYTPEAK